MRARSAAPEDAEAIAKVYNQGIEERIATFETRTRSAGEIREWFEADRLIVVVEEDGEVVAFATTSPYSSRECYSGVASFQSTLPARSVVAVRAGWRW